MSKLVLVMVGLPARGKTHIAKRVARYLSWLGCRTRVFNVGSYRRAKLGVYQHHSFFDPENVEAREARHHVAMEAADDLIRWLAMEGEVGIHDATNTSREQRAAVEARCRAAGHEVIFIESICDDPAVIDLNVRETKLLAPDYAHVDPDEATADFHARIAHYQKVYETLDDPSQSYVKIVDLGRTIIANRIDGYLPARIVAFLLSMHIRPRVVWLSRHGESAFNVSGRIGGNPDLSSRGEGYARSLAEFIAERTRGPSTYTVWTSTLRRSQQTARHLPTRATSFRALDEIHAGICDGMTYAEIEHSMPDEFAARGRDKFRYRYPRGESYEDVIQRLEPVIVELERQKEPVLIIAHNAVIRALYAYFMDWPPEVCPSLDVPLHTVIELIPGAYGCEERRYALRPSVIESPG